MDRRAAFFLVAAVMCFALAPLADTPHRPIAVITGVVYVILAVLSALDRYSRNHNEPRHPAQDVDAEP
jgi:hypothetical protein